MKADKTINSLHSLHTIQQFSIENIWTELKHLIDSKILYKILSANDQRSLSQNRYVSQSNRWLWAGLRIVHFCILLQLYILYTLYCIPSDDSFCFCIQWKLICCGLKHESKLDFIFAKICRIAEIFSSFAFKTIFKRFQ